MKLISFKIYFDDHNDHISILWRKLCQKTGLASEDSFFIIDNEEITKSEIFPQKGWFMDRLSQSGSFYLFKNGRLITLMMDTANSIEGTIKNTAYRVENNEWLEI